MSDTHVKPGWEYIIAADEAGVDITELKLSPNEEERAKIAELIGLVGLKSLDVDLKLKRQQGGLVVKISGDYTARVVQECVVSLEPVENDVKDSFDAWYADPDQAISFNKALKKRDMEKLHGEVPIVDEKDDPEPIIDGEIDLGDVVTQFLSLALDPYPHKEGVQYEIGDDSPKAEASAIRKNPFEKLKDWKAK